MVDKINKNKEAEMANSSVVISSIVEAGYFGLKRQDINLLCNQVSIAIGTYNKGHSSEMLPKPPEVIYKQLENGLSCLIVAKDPSDNEWKFLHHASIYPMFEDGEDRALGTQIVEFGSAITQNGFNGMGLHTIGTQKRLDMMKTFETNKIEVFGLSTVKRVVTGHTWSKFNVNPVSFWGNPYTSFLTNTCEGTSERYGHQSCKFRRSPDESDPSTLSNLFINKVKENIYLPCTLLVTDHEAMKRFENKCRDLHSKLGGQPLYPNEINVDAYRRANEFFNGLKK